MSNLEEITKAARQHANNLAADINNASTRIEHIRLTQLALEADRIATALESGLADL
jgi:hypothetical protein